MHADPRVLGLLYVGSQGRGAADRYSDLDIEVWVTADAFTRADATIDDILTALGQVHFVYTRGPGFVTAFVGSDWQRVDLHLHEATDTRTFPDYAGGRVVKDWDSTLARILESAPVTQVEADWEDARAVIEETIDSMVYLTLHNARGEHWSAAEEIVSRLATLYTLLARCRGRASYGLRSVTTMLTAEEQVLVTRAWPAKPEPSEVRRAAAELWSWTRYVWRETERCLGRSLEITLDDAALLAAIEAYYTPSVMS
jgi:hypothetical protein